MRLVLRRAARARTLLAAAALTAVLTTALLTGFVEYARLLPDAGIRAAVATVPANDRSLLVSGGAGDRGSDVDARAREIEARFGGGLGGLPVSITGGGYAIGQQLPDGFGGTAARAGGGYAVVAFLERLDAHSRLVAGDWPTPAADRSTPAQAALPETVAASLKVGVGDRIPITDRRGGTPAPLTVVGIFRPHDPSDPYWQLSAEALLAGGYGPLVVHRDDFLARYVVLATLQWVMEPTPVDLVRADLPAVGSAIVTLRADGIPGPDQAWFPVIRTGMDGLAGQLGTARVVTRSGLLLPALLIVMIAGYSLFLVARLLTEQRRGELALMRARGASRAQLAWLAAGEAVLVAVPAALLGAPLAAFLLDLSNRWTAPRGLRLAESGATPWLVAGLAAAGCAAALVLPAAARTRTYVAEQQERSRPGRWAVVQRAGVDLALVALAVLAWLQLRQYSGPLTQVGAGLDIDPLLVAAPALGVLAATSLSLRLLPAATRVGVGLAQRRGSFGRLLGMWHADRRPHAGPVLLLVLAVAVAGLATCVAATWQRSQRDQAAHQVGADLRLRANAGTFGMTTGDLVRPGVTGATAGHREQVNVGPTPAELVALDTTMGSDVLRLRADLTGPQALAPLRAGRPELVGVALPEGARRLAGRVSFDAGVRSPAVGSSGPLAAVVDVGNGLLHEVSLGAPGADGRLLIDAALPKPTAGGVLRLVGLTTSARVLVPGVTSALADPDLSWRFDDLRTLDQAGSATPLLFPARWSAAGGGDMSVPPAGTVTSTAGSLRLHSDPDPISAATITYLAADSSSIDALGLEREIPALVTPAVLSAAAARVGDVVRLGAGAGRPELPLRVVGVIGAVPSTTGSAAILVDLPSLSGYRFLRRQPMDPPREWWLATEAARHDRVAAELSGRPELTVTDLTVVTRRLLGDPLGWGVLFALYLAALGATVLAAFGLAVDARAAALRSAGELAVLHTLGTPPGTLARALVLEQSVLAGLGVVSGIGVGMAVATAMAPSLVLTASGGRPVPEVLLALPAAQVVVPGVALFAVALGLAAVIARRARREVTAGLLRIGGDT